jgi:hypothetical protein
MKRKRSEPPLQYVKPEESVSFDPLEFRLMFSYAAEVAHNPATVLNDPTEMKISIKDKGKVKKLVFKDIPMNRMGVSICQRFRGDNVKFMSFMWRWFAFVDLMHHDVLGGDFHKVALSKEQPDEIHNAVVELVGSFPVGPDGKFEHPAFMTQLRKKVADDDYLQ